MRAVWSCRRSGWDISTVEHLEGSNFSGDTIFSQLEYCVDISRYIAGVAILTSLGITKNTKHLWNALQRLKTGLILWDMGDPEPSITGDNIINMRDYADDLTIDRSAN